MSNVRPFEEMPSLSYLVPWILGIMLTLGVVTPTQAGVWGLRCAGRGIDKSYQSPQAVALVEAAVRGDSTQVAEIAERSPGLVNILEDGAVPPLLWPMCADSVEGFEALLKAGADPNLGGTGQGVGDGNGLRLKENGTIVSPGWSATVMAGGMARPEFLRLALSYGGDPNVEKGPRSRNRPLLVAAYYGLADNVKVLIAAGADINARDFGSSAPEYALDPGRFDIAVWLLELGYSNDLQRLASNAEIRHVPVHDVQQRWKELLIDMLQKRGAVFPASPGVRHAIMTEREIPTEDVMDIVLGRKSIFDYPKKAGRPPP